MAIDLKVWGDFACFTRPEFKVERVSYPVITPSAARGVLEAIYWKPQIRYEIQRIGVLEMGTQFSLLRNEMKSLQTKGGKGVQYAFDLIRDPERNIKKPGKGKSKRETALEKAAKQFNVSEDDRGQRTSLILSGQKRNGVFQPLCYRIQARIELRNGEQNIAKHLDQFRRRSERGQYFHKPFLGCREFAAEFEPADSEKDVPQEFDQSLGTMLFDTAYIADETWSTNKENKNNRLEFWQHYTEAASKADGYTKRIFFNAEINAGWMEIPPSKTYDILRKMEEAK